MPDDPLIAEARKVLAEIRETNARARAYLREYDARRARRAELRESRTGHDVAELADRDLQADNEQDPRRGRLGP